MPFDEYVKYWHGRARYVFVVVPEPVESPVLNSITYSTEAKGSACLYLKDWHFANQFGHRYSAYTTPDIFREVLVYPLAPRV